jgi:lysozyme
MITRRAIDIARDFIARFEGLELEAYICPAGVLTIGYGHTGDDVEHGDVITAEMAMSLLEADMTDAIECVDQYVDVDLDDGQIAALVSFIFNLGCGAFKGSTMLKLLNAGQLEKAGEHFKRWNKAGGKELSGLTRRREAEAKLFMGEL